MKKCRLLPLWTSIITKNESNAPVESFFNNLKNVIMEGSKCSAVATVVKKVDDYCTAKLIGRLTMKNPEMKRFDTMYIIIYLPTTFMCIIRKALSSDRCIEAEENWRNKNLKVTVNEW